MPAHRAGAHRAAASSRGAEPHSHTHHVKRAAGSRSAHAGDAVRCRPVRSAACWTVVVTISCIIVTVCGMPRIGRTSGEHRGAVLPLMSEVRGRTMAWGWAVGVHPAASSQRSPPARAMVAGRVGGLGPGGRALQDDGAPSGHPIVARGHRATPVAEAGAMPRAPDGVRNMSRASSVFAAYPRAAAPQCAVLWYHQATGQPSRVTRPRACPVVTGAHATGTRPKGASVVIWTLGCQMIGRREDLCWVFALACSLR